MCVNPLRPKNCLFHVMVRKNRVGLGSDGASTHKLKLLVVGAPDPSARVEKLIARKFRADNIFIATHAFEAIVWPKLPNIQISCHKICVFLSLCVSCISYSVLVYGLSNAAVHCMCAGACQGAMLLIIIRLKIMSMWPENSILIRVLVTRFTKRSSLFFWAEFQHLVNKEGTPEMSRS